MADNSDQLDFQMFFRVKQMSEQLIGLLFNIAILLFGREVHCYSYPECYCDAFIDSVLL